MKFKLDENFGVRTVPLFAQFGHEVETVRDEGISGASDVVVFEACKRECRCLVTLDLDFADVVRFSAHGTAGIAVLRVPRQFSAALLTQLVTNLLIMLKSESIDGCLWVVEAGRIRVRRAAEDAD